MMVGVAPGANSAQMVAGLFGQLGFGIDGANVMVSGRTAAGTVHHAR